MRSLVTVDIKMLLDVLIYSYICSSIFLIIGMTLSHISHNEMQLMDTLEILFFGMVPVINLVALVIVLREPKLIIDLFIKGN